MVLFALSPEAALSKAISRNMNVPLAKLTRRKLCNTETVIEIQESVRGKDAYVIFSCSKDFNESILDLLMIVEAMRNASVGLVTIVFPSFPYARYDMVTKQDRPAISKLVADMIGTCGCDRVLTMDLHSSQVQGYFDIPVDNISAEPAFRKWIKEAKLTEAIFVTPHPQGTKRVANLSETLGMNFAIVHSTYDTETKTGGMTLVGDVQGKVCIVYDDIADSCKQLCEASQFLKDMGAQAVHVLCTHGLFSEKGLQRCIASSIDNFVVTDTIDQSENLLKYPLLNVVDVSTIFAEALRRIHNKEPLLYLFSLYEKS